LLLGVPFLFQVATLSLLVYFQGRYEQSIQEINNRKHVMSHAGQMWRHAFSYISHHAEELGRITKLQYNYPVRRKELADDFRALRQKIRESEQAQRLEQMASLVTEITDEADALELAAPAARDNLKGFNASDSFSKLDALCQKAWHLSDLTMKFREHELERVALAQSSAAQDKVLISTVNVCLLVGSFVIAGWLLNFFMQSIHKGFRTMSENMSRFSKGEPLLQKLQGTDEIALLDHVFHNAADELALAEQQRSEFIRLLGKDLETPLRVVKDFLEQEALTQTDADAKKGAVKAKQNSERLLRLINELLNISCKRPRSLSDIRPALISVHDLIQESVDAILAFAEKKRIAINFQHASFTLYADLDRLIQVLVNLLSNAVKFSPEGSVIEIKASKVGSDWLEISVVDEGRGIPVEMQDKIFERFGQVDQSDATDKGGTGLGLPICKDIIEAHGGRIGAENVENGAGSRFWIRLPLNSLAIVRMANET